MFVPLVHRCLYSFRAKPYREKYSKDTLINYGEGILHTLNLYREWYETNDFRADYICFDSLAYWGKAIAKENGIPSIALHTIQPFDLNDFETEGYLYLQPYANAFANREFFNRTLHIFSRVAYEKYGLAQEFSFVDLLSAKGDSNLVLVPDFMCKYRNSLDGNYYIFNPIMEEVTCESECSDIAKDADDIVIYISTGSIINNQEFLYKCIEASLLIPNCEVHISAGVNFDEILKKYGDYSQLFVYKFAPQKAILNRAKLFITHGGMNSVCESIYYKTPMVIIPFVNDEYLNAIMVEQNNFGEMLKLNVSEQQLFETISRVICDESIANSISDASELMKSTNALEEVLTYFQSVVQKKTINSNM